MIEWQKCIGGNRYGIGASDGLSTVIKDWDGNYIVSGWTNDPNYPGIHWNDFIPDYLFAFSDILIVHLNPEGSILYHECWGGSWEESPGEYYNPGRQSIVIDEEGDIIVAGSTTSNDGDVEQNKFTNFSVEQNKSSGWVFSNSRSGWQKHWYEGDVGCIRAIETTGDGDYIVVGDAYSVTQQKRAYIARMNDTGYIEWEHKLPYDLSSFETVIEDDRGLFIAGGKAGGNAIIGIYYPNGEELDMKFFGIANASIRSISQVDGGPFVATGYCDGDYLMGDTYDPGRDLMVVVLDYFFSDYFIKTFGGEHQDEGNDIEVVPDGYIIVGTTKSEKFPTSLWVPSEPLHRNTSEFYYTHNGPFSDVLLLKLDRNLDLQWQRCLGGSHHDQGNSVMETNKGEYIIAGVTYSDDGDVQGFHKPTNVPPNLHGADGWVVKMTVEPPKIEYLMVDPKIPVTGKPFKIKAVIANPCLFAEPEYEITRVEWYVCAIDEKSSDEDDYFQYKKVKTQTNLPAYTFPELELTVPEGKYGIKGVMCRIYGQRNLFSPEELLDTKQLRFMVFFPMARFPDNWKTWTITPKWHVDSANPTKDGIKYPNWLHYWSLDNAVLDTEHFQYRLIEFSGAYDQMTDTLILGPDAAAFHTNWNIPYSELKGGIETFENDPHQYGIISLLNTIAHEKLHQTIYKEKVEPGGIFYGKADSDNDGLPDDFELGCLTSFWEPYGSLTWPYDADTYNIHQVFSYLPYADYGDQEYLCRRAGEVWQHSYGKWDDWSDSGDLAREQESILTDIEYSIINPTGSTFKSDYLLETGSSLSNPELLETGYTGNSGLEGMYSDLLVDTNGNGYAEWLQVSVDINANASAKYLVEGLLTGVNATPIASAYWGGQLEPGTYRCPIAFDGTEIVRSGNEAPYNLSVVMLWGSTEGSEVDRQENVHVTLPYELSDFEGAEIMLTGPYSDSGIDEDADTIFDYLEVDAGVEVLAAGEYTITAALEAGPDHITGTQASLSLVPGNHVIPLKFDGLLIGSRKLDGPYRVTNLTILDRESLVLEYLPDAWITGSYTYTQFRLPVIEVTSMSDEGVDTDSNGKYEWLNVTLELNVAHEGVYSFYGSLLDSRGGHIFDVERKVTLPAGNQQLIFYFPGEEIFGHRVDGSFLVPGITGIDHAGNLVSGYIPAYVTDPYQYRDFEGRFFSIKENPQDSGRDTNGNSLFDLLDVSFDLLAETPGTYSISASLETSEGSIIDAASDSVIFADENETQTITLSYSGLALSSSGYSGKYILKGIRIFEPATGYFRTLPERIITGVYSPDQFERYGIVTGTVTADTGWPVRGVKVSIPGVAWNTTDRFGRYRLSVYPGGSYEITAKAPDRYNLTSESASVAISEGGTAVQDFVLNSTGGSAPEVYFSQWGGTHGTSVNFTLYFDNFTGEPLVLLNRTGYSNVIGGNTRKWRNAFGTIIVEGILDLTDAPPGLWDFIVVFPDGKAWFAPDGFRVYDPNIPLPGANFTSNVTTGPGPLTVQFNDTSTGDPTRWLWTFVEGWSASPKSPEKDPVYTYTSTSDYHYSVSLTVENEGGTNTTTKIDYINVTRSTPVPDFRYSIGWPFSKTAPTTIQFTDLSKNSPAWWFWEFGDGQNSSEKSPLHLFNTTGLHNVSLTAGNSGGNATVTKQVNITFRGYLPTYGIKGTELTVDFYGNNPLPVEELYLERDSQVILFTDLNYGADRITGTIQIPEGVQTGGWKVMVRQCNVSYQMEEWIFYIYEPEEEFVPGSVFRSNRERTGVYPSWSPAPTADLTWSYDAGSAVRSSPVFSSGLVFIGCNGGTLYALNKQTGTLVWQFQTGGAITAAPAATGELVYVGSTDGRIYALDRETGAVVWNVDTGGAVESSPLIFDGLVFFGNNEGIFFALDAMTGGEQWRYPVEDPTDGPFISSPAAWIGNSIDEHMLFVISGYGSLHSFWPRDGSVSGEGQMWGSDGDSPASSPAVGVALVHVYDQEYPGDPEYGFDWYGLWVFKGDMEGTFHALDSGFMDEAWNIPYLGQIQSSPAFDGSRVYFGDNAGSLRAVDVQYGTEIWGQYLGAPIKSSPAISGDALYIGCDDGQLHAFNRFSGQPLWSFSTGGPVVSSPAINDGIVYFGSDDGYIYAIGRPSAPAIISFTPPHAIAGGDGFALVVEGTNFVEGSTVTWDGTDRNTTYLSDTHLEAVIQASDIASEGSHSVRVRNSDGSLSNVATFEVVSNPAPIITYLSPSSGVRGTTVQVTDLAGNNFQDGAGMNISRGSSSIDGSDINVVSLSTITCNLTIPQDAETGFWNVVVTNPDGQSGTLMDGFEILTEDDDPPASVMNLHNSTYALNSITWAWTDPTDADFAKVMVYQNGVFRTNVTRGTRFYDATGLVPDTNYTLGTHTVDMSGNINLTWVNHTARTSPGTTPAITVSVPNGGEDWKCGSTHTVMWDYTGDPGANVKIQLLKGTTVDRVITKSTSIGAGGSGSYSWTVPKNQAPGSNYRIRIISLSNPAYKDTSNSVFIISAVPSIKVQVPNGGENWKRGSTHSIKWDYTGDPGSNVKIVLLKGKTVNRVITKSTSIGAGGSGSYTWTVPKKQAPGSNYRIKIISTGNSKFQDKSNAAFTIGAALSTTGIEYDELQEDSGKTIDLNFTEYPGSTINIVSFNETPVGEIINNITLIESGELETNI